MKRVISVLEQDGIKKTRLLKTSFLRVKNYVKQKSREEGEKLEGEFSGDNAANIIRRIMEKEDVKPKELAERMGCVRQNISQMLNRGTVNMRYDSFYRMAEALGYEIILRKK
jgi:Mn-dependent DtxR family transcriptional regulator